MLIGIDASRALRARRTGTENYSLQLIRHLLALESEHRFRLYCDRIPPEGLFGPDASAESRVIPFPRLWTHVRLSWEMVWQPPDVLFIPAHVLPLIHPRRSVVTVHDLGYLYYPEAHPRWQRMYLHWSTRWNVHQSAHVVVDSEVTKADLIARYHVPPEKVTVVYPGRDETLYPVTDPAVLAAVRARYGLSERYILYVGTLQPRKNLVRLVEAFALMRNIVGAGLAPAQNGVGPSIAPAGNGDGAGSSGQPQGLLGQPQGLPLLVLAGKTGWLAEPIFRRVEELGLGDAVRFLGYVDDADLPALLSGAACFAFPSLYEGFGFPVLEAQACGTPVVASNVSSIPEVAGDGALFVDPHDTEALAGALARVLSDETLRAELIKRGFANVQRFSWRRCAEQMLAVLEMVGKGQGARGKGQKGSKRQGAGGHTQHATRNTEDLHPASCILHLDILGVRMDAVTAAETLDMIERFVREGRPRQVVTVNPEFVMEAQTNEPFRRVLNGAALALPDGVGLLWAARILGHRLPERVAGSDLVPRIAERAAARGWRLFFLGAAPGVAERAAARLVARYPGLTVAGTYAGSPAPAEEDDIVARVRKARPDILFVAYGAPAQDLWIGRNLERLGVPVCMGVGGTFDFIAGVAKRAPLWVQRLGLEWLHRLIHQPWRWRRQLALLRFAWSVLRERLTKG